MTTVYHRADRRTEAGFSLVELVVALAILALLASMLPGAFGMARRAWESVRRIEQSDAANASRTFIEQRLAEALPVLVADARGDRRSGFHGDERRVSFVAPSASGPAGGGIYRYDLSVEGAAGRHALVLRQSPLTAVAVAGSTDAPRTLADGLGTLRLRYFGRLSDDRDPRWHDAWPDGDRLPELVEIGEADGAATSDGMRFRSLVVPLRLRRHE